VIIIINNIISANIIIVTVVIFGQAFVDMALFTPCLLKGRSCTTKVTLFPAQCKCSTLSFLYPTNNFFEIWFIVSFYFNGMITNNVASASWGLHTYIDAKETESSRPNRGASLTNIFKVPSSTLDIQFLVISVYFIFLGERIATKELSSTLPKEAHLCSQ